MKIVDSKPKYSLVQLRRKKRRKYIVVVYPRVCESKIGRIGTSSGGVKIEEPHYPPN